MLADAEAAGVALDGAGRHYASAGALEIRRIHTPLFDAGSPRITGTSDAARNSHVILVDLAA